MPWRCLFFFFFVFDNNKRQDMKNQSSLFQENYFNKGSHKNDYFIGQISTLSVIFIQYLQIFLFSKYVLSFNYLILSTNLLKELQSYSISFILVFPNQNSLNSYEIVFYMITYILFKLFYLILKFRIFFIFFLIFIQFFAF